MTQPQLIQIKGKSFIIEINHFTGWVTAKGAEYIAMFGGYSVERIIEIIEKDNFKKIRN